jgi:hypothetical protein
VDGGTACKFELFKNIAIGITVPTMSRAMTEAKLKSCDSSRSSLTVLAGRGQYEYEARGVARVLMDMAESVSEHRVMGRVRPGSMWPAKNRIRQPEVRIEI